MPAREPKSRQKTFIEVVGRSGDKKGRFELTSGNINYFRLGAVDCTISLTYQQLIDLLEKEASYRDIDIKRIKLPEPHSDGDFYIMILEQEDNFADSIFLMDSTSSLKKLDPKRIDGGRYQFSKDMENGRKKGIYTWVAQVSVQCSLWIINRYLDKFLSHMKSENFTSKDVVISKSELRLTLQSFLKKLDS